MGAMLDQTMAVDARDTVVECSHLVHHERGDVVRPNVKEMEQWHRERWRGQ
jgi:hypothetical protein